MQSVEEEKMQIYHHLDSLKMEVFMINLSFEDYLLSRNFSFSTVKAYSYVVNQFIKQESQTSSLGFQEIMQYLHRITIVNRHKRSFYLLQSGIKKYYQYLLSSGVRSDDPSRRIFLKQRQKNIIHQDLFTSEELEILLKRNERYQTQTFGNKLIISFLIYQGLLVKEICNIKVGHINFDTGTIKVKGCKNTLGRKLDLWPSQMHWLEKYLKDKVKDNGDILLENKLKNSITSDDIHYLIETQKYLFADRKLCPTTIRQSVIANWLNEFKIPLADVQLLAGHKRPSSTERYKRLNITQAVKLVNRFHPI